MPQERSCGVCSPFGIASRAASAALGSVGLGLVDRTTPSLARRRRAPTERGGYNDHPDALVTAHATRPALHRSAATTGEDVWRLPREYGVRRVVRLRYRELIFLLDAEWRWWYEGDGCLKKGDGRKAVVVLHRRRTGWAGDSPRYTRFGSVGAGLSKKGVFLPNEPN